MKKDKIIYWITTGVVAAAMVMSAVMYLTKNEAIVKNFKTIGYPEFFLAILGVAKLLGAVVLLAPVWDNLKEWAYAGFAFVFIGAIWTHLATDTPWIPPLAFLILLGVSYRFKLRLKISTSKV